MPPRALSVLVLTRDDRLFAETERVCADRGHVLTRIEFLRNLQVALAAARPNVLLLDAGASPVEGARTATTIRAVHEGLAIVLAACRPQSVSVRGFRLVDTWRTGERIVDELELAYLGVPASFGQARVDPRI